MRKMIVYILLFVLAFNLLGSRLVFTIKQNWAYNKLDSKILQQQYNEKDLVLITIPLNMPYYADMEENVAYGETTIDGKHYAYVKRKVTNNILHLYCLPNVEMDKVVKDKNIHEANYAGDPQSQHQKQTYKLFNFEYVDLASKTIGIIFCEAKQKIYKTISANLLNNDAQSVIQPPELV